MAFYPHQAPANIVLAVKFLRMDEKLDDKRAPMEETSSPVRDKDVGSIEDEIDHQAEKNVVRKIDLNLISIFGVLYLMSFLGECVLFSRNRPSTTLMIFRPLKHW